MIRARPAGSSEKPKTHEGIQKLHVFTGMLAAWFPFMGPGNSADQDHLGRSAPKNVGQKTG